MEVIQAKLDSTRPFYVNAKGDVFNEFYELVEGWDSKDTTPVNSICYVNSITGKKRNFYRARLIYQSFNPEENLEGKVVCRKRTDIRYPYRLDNLMVTTNSDLLKRVRTSTSGLWRGKDTFYANFKKQEMDLLMTRLKRPSMTNTAIAKIYKISLPAIARAKSKLLKVEEKVTD